VGDLEPLLRERRDLTRKLPRNVRLIKGSLVELHRTCGKPNCRCLKGEKHRALYLSRSREGKTTMTYIPAAYERPVRQAVARYRTLLEISEAISEINLAIIKSQGKL
jgi:hypothetical protein